MVNTSPILVLGAGIAGLLAAKVAAESGRTVTIFERDILPHDPVPRSGVAQGHHAHLLLKRGLIEFEGIVPGYQERVLAHEGVVTNATRDWYSLFPMGLLRRFVSDIDFVCASRWAIELALRELVLSDTRITIAPEHTVLDVRLSKTLSPVVQCRSVAGTRETFEPELVIDATGRGSKAPAWLLAGGFPVARRETVRPYLGYATRTYKQVNIPKGLKGLVIMAKSGVTNRGGVIFPIDNHRHICTLFGFSREYPPTEDREFLEFAQSLRSPAIYDVLLDATPESGIRAFRKDESHYNHYGDGSWPTGFLVTGDAVCSFNPIYGQGMTSAALAAKALRVDLKTPGGPAWARGAQRSITRAFREPWKTAKSEDLRFPDTEFPGSRLLARLEHRIGDMIGLAATRRDVVSREYVAAIHMLASNTDLLRPRTLIQVVAGLMSRAAVNAD